MRTQLSKALQTRCKTIRRAVDRYNTAAAALSPPREPLDWSKVSHYGFIEEFLFLRDTRNDIREKMWVKPLYREMMKLRHRIARAKEEVTRCNVETRRLFTSICDETAHFSRILVSLKGRNDPMYGPISDFVKNRRRINGALLKRVRQIHTLPGFTGDTTRGVRVGCERPIPSGPDSEVEDVDRDTPGSSQAEEEEDVEDDDDFHHNMRGMETYYASMST